MSKEAYANCRRVIGASRKWILPTESQRRLYNSTLGRLRLIATMSRPFEFLGPRNAGLRAWFASLVAREDYDVIWIGQPRWAFALGWRDPRRTVLDGNDYEYVREFHLLNLYEPDGSKALNYLNLAKLYWWERRLPRSYARVIRCSPQDRKRLPANNVIVIPNGATLPGPIPRRAPEQRVLFVGALSYAPNGMGVDWFVSKVWPAIRKEIPEAAFDIVGSDPSLELRNQCGKDGVCVHGFVADLSPFWRRAAVSVVPLLAGAGTRLKIPESLAYEVPVVSTRIGAFGLELGMNEGVWQVDDPVRFADRCSDLLRAPHVGIWPLEGQRGCCRTIQLAPHSEANREPPREVAALRRH